MAGALKTAFIEAVRLTPDGIADFLETPLPAVAAIVAPADNTATEALSAHLLKVFDALAGLTIVELLLRIGQHNSILESAMLAGLEYIEGADSSENLLTIVEPQEGVAYNPGEMRFTATVSNALCVGIVLVINSGDPIKMQFVDDQWQQYVTVEIGDYTAAMTASFEDGSTADASVSFSVADAGAQPPPETPPEPPGGKDKAALLRAQENVKKAYRDLIGALTGLGDPDSPPILPEDLADYQNATTLATAFVGAVNTFLSYAPETAQSLVDEVQTLLGTLSPVIWTNVTTVLNNSTTVMNLVNQIASM